MLEWIFELHLSYLRRSSSSNQPPFVPCLWGFKLEPIIIIYSSSIHSTSSDKAQVPIYDSGPLSLQYFFLLNLIIIIIIIIIIINLFKPWVQLDLCGLGWIFVMGRVELNFFFTHCDGLGWVGFHTHPLTCSKVLNIFYYKILGKVNRYS